MRVGIIGNSKSGFNCDHSLEELKAGLTRDTAIYLTDTVSELRRVLSELNQKQVEVLAIRGGDGTLRLVVEEALAVWQKQPLPKILLLRGGTMNVVASSVGILPRHGSAAIILQHYIKDASRFRTIALPLLQVSNHFGFIFGCGCFVNYLEEYYQVPKPTPWRAMALLLKSIGSILIGGKTSQKTFAPVAMELHVDDHCISSGNHTLIAVSCVRQCGLNIQPFYLAGSHEQLHLLYTQSSPLQILCNCLNFYKGQPAPMARRIFNRPIREMELKSTSPIRYSLDGELFTGANSLPIKHGPTLTMLTPRF